VELAIVLAVIVVIALLGAMPTLIRNKRLGKKGVSALSAGLGVINELYAPSAKNAAVIQEEKREAIKPKPSPEEKENPDQ
jgi:competence protein ComGC